MFNDDIGAWDVSAVTTMGGMFRDVSFFNQPLSDWRVDKVTNMLAMFRGAESFDQDLGWCVDDGVNTALMFSGTACRLPSCNVTFGGCPP